MIGSFKGGVAADFADYLERTGVYATREICTVERIHGDAHSIAMVAAKLPFAAPVVRMDFGFNESWTELRKRGFTANHLVRLIRTVLTIHSSMVPIFCAFVHAYPVGNRPRQPTDAHAFALAFDTRTRRYVNPLFNNSSRLILRILCTLTSIRFNLSRPDKAPAQLVQRGNAERRRRQPEREKAIHEIEKLAREKPGLMHLKEFWEELKKRGVEKVSSHKHRSTWRAILRVKSGQSVVTVRLAGLVFAPNPPRRSIDLPLAGESDQQFRRRLSALLRTLLRSRRQRAERFVFGRNPTNARRVPELQTHQTYEPDPSISRSAQVIRAFFPLTRAADEIHRSVDGAAAFQHEAESLGVEAASLIRKTGGRGTASIVKGAARVRELNRAIRTTLDRARATLERTYCADGTPRATGSESARATGRTKAELKSMLARFSDAHRQRRRT